jgi:hypothetical protein
MISRVAPSFLPMKQGGVSKGFYGGYGSLPINAQPTIGLIEYEDVPNHNNYGEYIIKKGILKRKVSGGSMSEEGVTAYAVLQSIAQTCHLRGLSFTGFLTASLLQYIRTGKLLLLSEYEFQIISKQASKEAI